MGEGRDGSRRAVIGQRRPSAGPCPTGPCLALAAVGRMPRGDLTAGGTGGRRPGGR